MGKRAAHSLHREGIAVIGVAFRFPGDLDNEDAFWKALTSGRDLVTEIGPERWAVEELQHPKRSEPGRSVTFSAGVLSRIDEFDAGFFGISPREAVLLDPQQRLLLELAWEAMENGGQVPARLAGSDCAVYVGVSALDYGLRGISDFSNVSMHTMTGNTLSIAANRISYAFDLHGPSLSVDTACSSSLVALHQACDALQRGEAPMALVGGVNLLLHPYAFVGFTKASMISANGRCRAFDAAADGYVRAEGGAVLLLKPLAQAEKDGDAIQAVIRATGVNSDGGRKTGITIPSSEGQADLMRSALKKSGIRPEDVAYIEAHGTGTAVGDPVEANAIGEVYGRERKAPLSIGSVKTNLGHLEAASGMAGLVKTMLMLKHEALPPSLHFETPNPHIPFADLNLQVVTQHTPLQKDKNPPVMGVNSFGFGGANAHALLQGYRPVSGAKPSRPPHVPPLFLSARTQEALQDMAGRYVGLLQDPDAAEYYDIAYSAAFHRQHLEHRLAIMPADARSARAMLESYAAGEAMAGVIEENALSASASDGVTFVYSGNGAQWEGMGRKLLRELPAFAAIIKELDAAIARKAGFSVLDALTENENNADLSDTAIAQPLLFAMQVAITKILRARGVEAKAAAGHSVGEVAAAWATGALSLSQAIDVICARSAAQAKTRGKGRMAAVGLPEDAIREILDEGGYSTIEIAGVNSPSNVTLAGSLAELEALQAQLQPRGTFYRLLDLDYAFHSRAMDGIRTDIGKSLAALSPSATAIDFVSTVTGDVLEGQSLGAGYWWDNVRKPVRFAAGMETLIKRGCGILLEIGPHAILQRYMTECLLKEGGAGRALPTLRRDDDGLSRLDGAVLRVHMSRHEPDPSFFFPQKGRFTPLPNYPWQRERYLVSETTESASILERRRVHPLLGWRLKDHEAAWENVLDPVEYPYLADHRVGGSIVLPATGYLEMALAASREWFKGERFKIEEMNIIAPVVFDGEHARSIRFLFSPREGTFRILSRERLSADDWTLNAAGLLLGAPARRARNGASVSRPKKAVTVKAQEHYRLFDALGLDYGPAFRGFARGSMKGDVLTGKFELPDALQEDIDDYMLHPALLDACFQPLVNFFKDEVEAGRGRAFLPIKTGRLQYFGGGPVTDFEIRLQSRSRRSIRADFILQDAAGEAVALLEGCRFRAAPLRRKSEARPVRWRIDARLAPHASVCSAPELPGSREWIKTAQDYMAQAEPSLQRQRIFGEYQPLLDALVVAYAYRAFHTLDEKMRPWLNKVLDEPETITEDRRPFFIFLNRLLQDVGLLKRAGTGWEIETADAPPAPEKILSALFADFPEALPALLIAMRTGENLTEAFCGEASAPALLQPAHGVYASEMLFSAAPSYSGINHALREMLRAAAVDWPENRRLRILEIAGTANSLPHDLKDCLPQNRVDYVIAEADADRHAVLKAEYHGHPFVTVASLDAEDVTLSAETMLPAEYDVVIVNHYLHRAPNVMATAAALRRFLAKGGRLVLAERHPSYVADFTFGPDPAWWRTTGAGYSSSLRAPGMWEALLKTQGFDDVGQFIEQADGETETGSFLLLASNPESIVQTPAPAPSTWLLLGGGDTLSASLAERLSARLTAQGQAVEFVQAEGSGDAAQMTRLLQRAQEEMNAVEHVVFFGAMNDAAEPALPTNDDTRCMDALHLVQAVAAQGNGKPRLWFVTSGGALVTEPRGDWAIHPAAAPLWGLGRVVMNEVPDCSCTLIDMACDVRADEAVERLQAELLFPDDEREIVLSADARFALRLQHDAQENAGTSAGASGFQLDFTVPGHLRNLSWLPKEEQALGEDEIEVRPAAVGLNFRDIMYAMGLLPDEAVENGFAGATLGLEFAGTITRVGAKTGEFSVGDEVMGFGAGCFSSHVVTKACAVTKKPEGWTFAQAATVPTTFFTAYYAIKRLANLQPGERILIHGAAGGVGIAAIQLARYLGAEIFATAGTEEKRDFVRLLGADHVLDSRSLDFADDILGITGGEGIDVVLNSLSGEAISRNLRVLKPFGRFLELGKRDFYENTHIGLAPFRNNISYFGIDADQLLVCQPHIAPVVFGEVMALFDSGDLTPLPYKTFAAERVADAFRYMQQSRHIGKVVVDLADARVPVQQQDNAMAASAPGLADANSSYLVTGGLEGFGLETACRLATLGVKSLVLLSRRGKESPGAAEAVARLEALGAQAHVFACDVNDLSVLEVVFAAIKKDLPPLKGIVHAAAVFDDGLLSNMEEERFSRVLQPKTLGAWNLHSLSAGLPLDHFILYSSISTLIGNPGQGNYVAANAYLEALASWRQASGLPATCISWGPIGDAGYLSRNDAVKENLASRLGAAPLSVQQALALLPSILAEKRPHIAIADFNLLSLGRFLPSASGPRFEALRHFMDAGETANETDDILELIAGKPRQEVQQIVQDIIVSEVAGILRVSYERVHLTRPLQQLGMDSLMAVELVIALEQRFGVSLPAMAMSDDQANIERISARIADKLCGEETADNADNIEDLVSAMAAQHIGEVSEQDLSETIEEVRERSLEKGRLIS